MKSLMSFALMIALLFAFSSCEEDEMTEDTQQTSVLASFSGENSSLQIIGDNNLGVMPGPLPYLTSENENIIPEGSMLFVPQQAYEDDVVEHSEILALIAVPGNQWMLHQEENFPGSQWLRFSGEEFFPGSRWTPGNDELSVPGNQWMPDELADLDVLFYSREGNVADFIGQNYSENKISVPAGEGMSFESDKQQLALAVPASHLLNLDMELNTNLAEAIYESAGAIDFPTEKGSQISASNGSISAVFRFFSEPQETGYASIQVNGEDFFPDDTFTPSTVSVFTAPMTEVFEQTSASPNVGGGYENDARILFFGSDYFLEPPHDMYTVTAPGRELDVTNTRVVLAPSVMNIQQGLTLAISPGALNLGDSPDGTTWPPEYYHPGEFEFPGVMYPPETSPELKNWRFTNYSPEVIQEIGVLVQSEGLR